MYETFEDGVLCGEGLHTFNGLQTVGGELEAPCDDARATAPEGVGDEETPEVEARPTAGNGADNVASYLTSEKSEPFKELPQETALVVGATVTKETVTPPVQPEDRSGEAALQDIRGFLSRGSSHAEDDGNPPTAEQKQLSDVHAEGIAQWQQRQTPEDELAPKVAAAFTEVLSTAASSKGSTEYLPQTTEQTDKTIMALYADVRHLSARNVTDPIKLALHTTVEQVDAAIRVGVQAGLEKHEIAAALAAHPDNVLESIQKFVANYRTGLTSIASNDPGLHASVPIDIQRAFAAASANPEEHVARLEKYQADAATYAQKYQESYGEPIHPQALSTLCAQEDPVDAFVQKHSVIKEFRHQYPDSTGVELQDIADAVFTQEKPEQALMTLKANIDVVQHALEVGMNRDEVRKMTFGVSGSLSARMTLVETVRDHSYDEVQTLSLAEAAQARDIVDIMKELVKGPRDTWLGRTAVSTLTMVVLRSQVRDYLSGAATNIDPAKAAVGLTKLYQQFVRAGGDPKILANENILHAVSREYAARRRW